VTVAGVTIGCVVVGAVNEVVVLDRIVVLVTE
jgi:hypothetical protein